MLDAAEALAAWGLRGALRDAPDAGLINRTWLVGEPAAYVLQWVNPIFRPTVNLDLAEVTARLAVRGMATPVLLPTREGRAWLDDTGGCWRLLTFVPGRTLHRLGGRRQAAAVGALVGRFHAALDGWARAPVHLRPGAHDTVAHMRTLRAALDDADGHALAGPAREVGGRILAAWERWDGRLDLPERVCHGDLKVSNVRFDDRGRRALCLLDLDTISLLPLAVEMGDAWRSWCNPAGEDQPDEARFDLGLFEASAHAWMSSGPGLDPVERDGLAAGIERVCLELAARFCADAVRNAYFREDRQRWPLPGEHNLLRARGQAALADAARRARPACESILARARTRDALDER